MLAVKQSSNSKHFSDLFSAKGRIKCHYTHKMGDVIFIFPRDGTCKNIPQELLKYYQFLHKEEGEVT